MSQPAIGYLDPVFVEMMEELKALLRYAYQTKNALTFPISGPGSVGMEYCFVNLVRAGRQGLVCRNGVFGGRMIENVERCGGMPGRRRGRVGRAGRSAEARGRAQEEPRREGRRVRARGNFDRRAVRRQDAGRRSRTSTTRWRSSTRSPRSAARRCWSTSGSIDAIYSASQKCLSCTPGLSPVSFSERVVELREGAQGQDPQLVHGHEPAARLLGRDHAHLSPHRADQLAVRAARSAAADPRGRARELLGAPPAPPPRAQGRASKRWASSSW